MAALTETERMLPIASILSQQQMRRSLVGAAASDPVVTARRRDTGRATQATAAGRVTADRSGFPHSCAREKPQTA
jgi:hypothetical protein